MPLPRRRMQAACAAHLEAVQCLRQGATGTNILHRCPDGGPLCALAKLTTLAPAAVAGSPALSALLAEAVVGLPQVSGSDQLYLDGVRGTCEGRTVQCITRAD